MENPALASTWIRRAKEYEKHGDQNSARIASLKAARLAAANGETLPNDWARALNNDQQADIELLMGNPAQSDQYRLTLQSLDYTRPRSKMRKAGSDKFRCPCPAT